MESLATVQNIETGEYLYSKMGFFVPLGIPATLRCYIYNGVRYAIVSVEGYVACIRSDVFDPESELEGIFEGVSADE